VSPYALLPQLKWLCRSRLDKLKKHESRTLALLDVHCFPKDIGLIDA
jgi:hypothetical protein